MPTCTVNGVEVTVESGTNVLEAAQQAGFEVPYFCYHPGLSAPANCRACVIDLGGGRLGPSCYTQTADGAEYHTDTDQVRDFQKANLEFILLNHPVDCPICDKAGECMLQDQYYQFSRRPSRLRVGKTSKPKVVDIGPEVVLDAERCILCTRCIRVCDEIAGEPQLCIINRGDRSEISVFPGRRLDHPYSLCTVDVCPVGALTSKDFRFKARAWFLTSTHSVCPGCATGCNVYLDHTDGVARRLTPRHNPDVNGWWMCDAGRSTYRPVQEERILVPSTLVDGEVTGATWTDALSRCADRLNLAREANGGGAVAVIASPWCTNEDLWMLARFASECLGTRSVYRGGRPPGEADDILRDADKNPNTAGLEAIFAAFDIEVHDLDALLADLQSGAVSAVYQVGGDLPAPMDLLRETLQATSDTWRFVVQTSNVCAAAEKAQVVLPAAAWAEVDGTFTNRDGRVQRVRAAVPPKGSSRPHWEITGLVAQRMGFDLAVEGPRQLLRELAAKVPRFAGVAPESVGPGGVATAPEAGPQATAP